MKRSRFTEEQIIRFIKRAEAGIAIKELCREGGLNNPILNCPWKRVKTNFTVTIKAWWNGLLRGPSLQYRP